MSAQPISIVLGTGTEYAAAASELLNEAWSPPCIFYSRAYLEWQCSFPCPWPLPAVAAFDRDTLVGFAATTGRRIRHRGELIWVVIVSFVAVRPAWQQRGVAAALYDRLLGAVRDLGVPVITFAIPDSPGERVLEQAYVRAGFAMRSFGEYPAYMAVFSGDADTPEWESCVCDAENPPADIAAQRASDETLAWHAPDSASIAHYRSDPRPRKLVLLRRHGEEWSQAAFAVLAESHTRQGIQVVPTAEPVLLEKNEPAALRALIKATASAFDLKPGAIISIPNVIQFDNGALRLARVRKVGGGFRGFLCRAELPFDGAVGTTLEIV